jgi:hypothetical protein
MIISMNESTYPKIHITWYNCKDGIVIPTQYVIRVIYTSVWSTSCDKTETELDGLNNEIQNVLDKFDCYNPRYLLK